MMTAQEKSRLALGYIAGIRLLFAEDLREVAFAADDSTPELKLLHVCVTFEAAMLRRPTRADWLLWLMEMKRAVRFAENIADGIIEDHADELRGYVYGDPPPNLPTMTWWFLLTVGLELTKAILSTEDEHPEMNDHFATERAAYQQFREQERAACHEL